MNSNPVCVYIFLGPEAGKKKDTVNVIKERFINKKETEEFVFYADETPASRIADILQTMSLFAEKRVIVVKNAETIKNKDDINLLVSCINNIEENTLLFLLSDENRIEAGFDKINANRQVFYEMFERDKIEWVRDFFKREGLNIDKNGIAIILEMVENNTDALRQECSRLINFLHGSDSSKDKNINVQDIEKWLSHNREESAFTLFSRIAAGDLSKALESLTIMLAAKERAPGILAGLSWCFGKLRDYLSLVETGNANNSFELKKIGIYSPKSKDDYAAASQRYNTESTEACLALTAKYDVLMRSPLSVMENILMHRYILAVMNTAKKPFAF
ncbi:MAG: DNA polymerase III subunit delta [Treponema sp.]|jgi:DNA polymerase-3 subunit delta|nr:DNA polymerase III subunit delta [Treponema sp.]